MLRSIDELLHYRLRAKDAVLGSIKDVCFDDVSWTVRYFVADTRRWIPLRRVLLFASLVGEPDWLDRAIPVELTREQIENPNTLTEELKFFTGYGAGVTGCYRWQPCTTARQSGMQDVCDDHLHSFRDVKTYRIKAADGRVGYLDDLIADAHGWVLRHLVVDTRRWLPGGTKVLVSADSVQHVNCSKREVKVDLSHDLVSRSPRFDPTAPVNKKVMTRLYDYHGRPQDWL